MTTVVDASVVIAALIDTGPTGVWAESLLTRGALTAPHHMPVEVAAVLRRSASAGRISDDVAALAHGDLVSLPIQYFPYALLAPRAWQLRASVTPYDAWYVALAEALDVPLSTLDARLSRADGPRCAFELPPRQA